MIREGMLVLEPMWITVAIQLLTLIVAAGISYGMTKARLASHEKDIASLRTESDKIRLDSEKIRTDFERWKRERLHSIMTEKDCEQLQLKCRTSICGKIEKLSEKFDLYTLNAQANAQRNAMFIGAVCDKLNIPVPEIK